MYMFAILDSENPQHMTHNRILQKHDYRELHFIGPVQLTYTSPLTTNVKSAQFAESNCN